MTMFRKTLVIFCTFICLFAARNISAQNEKLGDIRYSAPSGFTKNAKDHAVVYSQIDQKSGNFCFITLYTASPSDGTAQKDFSREWKTRVVEPWGGEANPKTETEKADGWTVIAGGGQVDFNGNKAIAFLSVVSGFGKTVSVLGILNDESYLPPFQAFVESMNVDKTPMAAAPASIPQLQYDASGRMIVPLPNRQLTIADLAGEWGEDAKRISTTYVYRSSGSYAGSDNLTFRSKQSFTKSGGYLNDFFAIQNGKKIIEKTTGTFSINGRVLSIKQGNLAKYVIRGWLELPDMTILVVCGPWYEADVIPNEIFTNPAQGANLNNTWVRKK